MIKRVFEVNIEEEKIDEYLEQLDYKTLLKLEAIMYFGRDDDDEVLEDKIRYFTELDEPKDELVRTIIEKRAAYPIYFQKAIVKARDAKIDLNSI